jgi:hypothetical protein
MLLNIVLLPTAITVWRQCSYFTMKIRLDLSFLECDLELKPFAAMLPACSKHKILSRVTDLEKKKFPVIWGIHRPCAGNLLAIMCELSLWIKIIVHSCSRWLVVLGLGYRCHMSLPTGCRSIYSTSDSPLYLSNQFNVCVCPSWNLKGIMNLFLMPLSLSLSL